MTADNAIETPTAPAIKMHHMIAVRIGRRSTGSIGYVINCTGPVSGRTAIVDSPWLVQASTGRLFPSFVLLLTAVACPVARQFNQPAPTIHDSISHVDGGSPRRPGSSPPQPPPASVQY